MAWGGIGLYENAEALELGNSQSPSRLKGLK